LGLDQSRLRPRHADRDAQALALRTELVLERRERALERPRKMRRLHDETIAEHDLEIFDDEPSRRDRLLIDEEVGHPPRERRQEGHAMSELSFEVAGLLLEVLRLKEEPRSEEHTSELQSRENLVCRLLL